MFRFKTNLHQVQEQILDELERRVKSLKPQEIEMQTWGPGLVDLKIEVKRPDFDLALYVEQLFAKATPKVFQELGVQLQENMKAGNWGWRDGNRDIVDTGALMESQEITISGFSASVSYNSPYAAITHYGGYIYPYGNTNTTKVYLPGRPWVTATIEGGGPVPAFDFYAAYLNAIEGY